MKQSSNRSAIRSSPGTIPIANPIKANGNAQWFGPNPGGLWCHGSTGLGTNFFELAGHPGIDNGQPVDEFNGWDMGPQLFPLISPPLNSLGESSVAEANVEVVQRDENVSIDSLAAYDQRDDQEPADTIYQQLTSLSQKSMRAARRLSRRDSTPPSVSSLDVNNAFEDANTLIRIISTMSTSPAEDEGSGSSALMGHGNTLLTLAAHQHLLYLFTTICNTISQHLKSMTLPGDEHWQQGQRRKQSLHQSDFGPPSLPAQFVMVLQLLMHLINRLDRSLFYVDGAGVEGGYVAEAPTSGIHDLVTPADIAEESTPHALLIARGPRGRSIGSPSIRGGLPTSAQAILKSIPEDHEKLRQIIKELQTRMEHPELH